MSHQPTNPPHQQLLDLRSLDSSALPDLSLNSLHQPRLELELGPTDLSISLPDVSSSPLPSSKQPADTDDPLKRSQQLSYDLSRHPSKRWTSFSELGKSVLRLKSFERSTIHGSSPYLRPRLVQMKPASTYSTTSGSRHLFKLFHQDHPNAPDTQPELPHASSSCFTLPILPTMSESLSTSFDKELSSIADHPIILEEPADLTKATSTSLPAAHLSESGPPQRAQSIVSSQSDPIISYATPVSSYATPASVLSSPVATDPQDPVETSQAGGAHPSSPTEVPKELPTIEDATDQDVVAKSSDQPPEPEAEETKVEQTEQDEGAVTKKGPSIEILNRSDESQSNEDPTTTTKTCEQPTTTTITATTEVPQNDQKMAGTTDTLGRKKKFSQSASFFKLFIKGIGHLKPGHSSHDSSKTLARTTTVSNNH